MPIILLLIFILIIPYKTNASDISLSQYEVHDIEGYDTFLDSKDVPEIKGVSCIGCRRNLTYSYSGMVTKLTGRIVAIAQYRDVSYKLYTENKSFYIDHYKHPTEGAESISLFNNRKDKGSKHKTSRFSFNSPLVQGINQSGKMITVYDKYFYYDDEKYHHQ